MLEEKFLIDANTLITPYRQYYAFDLIPSFWEKLSGSSSLGRVILLDTVKEEILKGGDKLSDWLREQNGFPICKHVSAEIIDQYQQVLQYVQECGLYKENALKIWSQENVADPWLIAAAKVNGYTIITLETHSGGLSEKKPNAKAFIPDVADAFGVKSANLFYMMRQLAIQI